MELWVVCVQHDLTPPQHTGQGVRIHSVIEPAMCHYKLTVCVPELCTAIEEDASGQEGSQEDEEEEEEEQTEAVRDAEKTELPRQQSVPSGSGEVPSGTASEGVAGSQNADPAHPDRFYGLLWNNIVATDDEPLWWVSAVKPVTSLTR